MSLLNFSHYLDGVINIVTISWEADNTNTELTFARIYEKIQPLHDKKILLDLRNLTYCNSMFLGHSAALHVDLANKQGNLAIVVNQTILDPFSITGIDRLTTVSLDFDKTLQYLNNTTISPNI